MKLLFSILFFVTCLFLSEKSISQPGTPDKNFGTNGITTSDFYQNNDYGYAMAIQSDGKVLFAGTSNDSLNGRHVSVCRYSKDGFLDTSFGSKGKVFLGLNSYAIIRSIALQSDKKIVLAGAV